MEDGGLRECHTEADHWLRSFGSVCLLSENAAVQGERNTKFRFGFRSLHSRLGSSSFLGPFYRAFAEGFFTPNRSAINAKEAPTKCLPPESSPGRSTC